MTQQTKLDNLEEAIRKNTYRPEKGEEVLNIYPPLACSSRYENHSHMAIILFVGLAKYGGLDSQDVCSKLCIGHDEWFFKLRDFEERRKAATPTVRGLKLSFEGARFRNKIRLINNYLRINYGYESN